MRLAINLYSFRCLLGAWSCIATASGIWIQRILRDE